MSSDKEHKDRLLLTLRKIEKDPKKHFPTSVIEDLRIAVLDDDEKIYLLGISLTADILVDNIETIKQKKFAELIGFRFISHARSDKVLRFVHEYIKLESAENFRSLSGSRFLVSAVIALAETEENSLRYINLILDHAKKLCQISEKTFTAIVQYAKKTECSDETRKRISSKMCEICSDMRIYGVTKTKFKIRLSMFFQIYDNGPQRRALFRCLIVMCNTPLILLLAHEPMCLRSLQSAVLSEDDRVVEDCLWFLETALGEYQFLTSSPQKIFFVAAMMTSGISDSISHLSLFSEDKNQLIQDRASQLYCRTVEARNMLINHNIANLIDLPLPVREKTHLTPKVEDESLEFLSQGDTILSSEKLRKYLLNIFAVKRPDESSTRKFDETLDRSNVTRFENHLCWNWLCIVQLIDVLETRRHSLLLGVFLKRMFAFFERLHHTGLNLEAKNSSLIKIGRILVDYGLQNIGKDSTMGKKLLEYMKSFTRAVWENLFDLVIVDPHKASYCNILFATQIFNDVNCDLLLNRGDFLEDVLEASCNQSSFFVYSNLIQGIELCSELEDQFSRILNSDYPIQLREAVYRNLVFRVITNKTTGFESILLCMLEGIRHEHDTRLRNYAINCLLNVVERKEVCQVLIDLETRLPTKLPRLVQLAIFRHNNCLDDSYFKNLLDFDEDLEEYDKILLKNSVEEKQLEPLILPRPCCDYLTLLASLPWCLSLSSAETESDRKICFLEYWKDREESLVRNLTIESRNKIGFCLAAEFPEMELPFVINVYLGAQKIHSQMSFSKREKILLKIEFENEESRNKITKPRELFLSYPSFFFSFCNNSRGSRLLQRVNFLETTKKRLESLLESPDKSQNASVAWAVFHHPNKVLLNLLKKVAQKARNLTTRYRVCLGFIIFARSNEFLNTQTVVEASEPKDAERVRFLQISEQHTLTAREFLLFETVSHMHNSIVSKKLAQDLKDYLQLGHAELNPVLWYQCVKHFQIYSFPLSVMSFVAQSLFHSNGFVKSEKDKLIDALSKLDTLEEVAVARELAKK